MKHTEIIGRSLYYIFGAFSIIGILNFPIQVLQLILLGRLNFPDLHLPFEVPLWLILVISFILLLLGMLGAGILWARLGIAKVQNQVMNENNPQMLEVLQRLERIENKLTIPENDWR